MMLELTDYEAAELKIILASYVSNAASELHDYAPRGFGAATSIKKKIEVNEENA